MGVLSKLESKARHDIEITHYISRIQIESRVLGDVARNHVVPTAIKYQNILIDNVRGIKEIYGSNFMNFAQEQLKLIESISKYIGGINANVTKMINLRKAANLEASIEVRAKCIVKLLNLC